MPLYSVAQSSKYHNTQIFSAGMVPIYGNEGADESCPWPAVQLCVGETSLSSGRPEEMMHQQVRITA